MKYVVIIMASIMALIEGVMSYAVWESDKFLSGPLAIGGGFITLLTVCVALTALEHR